MDDGDSLTVDVRPEKRKREEREKGRHEEDLRGNIREHSTTESHRVHPSQGFYSEEWQKELQDEDDYQSPDKFQRVSRIVFPTESQRFLWSITKGADVAYST